MKTFFVALFSVVVLLGLVSPSSAHVIGRRETNAERLARGLTPNPPTRRLTAPVRRSSPTPPKTNQCLEVRDLAGHVLGCVDNGGSSHGISIGDKRNWPLTYDPSAHTLNHGAQFLGAHENPVVILGPALPTSVFLQKVSINDVNAQADLWTADPTTNQVTAIWTNPGNVHVAAQVCRDGDSIKLSGNCQASGLPQVLLFLTPI